MMEKKEMERTEDGYGRWTKVGDEEMEGCEYWYRR